MGNAQEAIKDYEKKVHQNGHVDTAEALAHDPTKAVTMILGHEYDEQGNIFYKAQ